MEFRILGPLEVYEDGRRVELGGARQRALLAILLTRANHVVSKDRLIDELFGEEPRESAASLLQVYVSRLRKALEPGRKRRQQTGIVVTKAPGYLVHVERDELDLERFERLAEEGRTALAESVPALARERFAEALALWRGPALADFELEPFAQGESRRLEELRLAVVEDRIDADLALGRHATLVGELESLVDLHPLRERLRGQLMLALYRSERQAEALDVYQATRRTLVGELGIEPSGRLQDLERAILRQDPELDGDREAQQPAPGRTILVVGADEPSLEAAVDLVEPLAAGEAPRELVAVALVAGAGELNETVTRLHARRDRLRAAGVAARVAAFTSTSPAGDVLRLASERGVELVLAGAKLSDGLLRGDWLAEVAAAVPCDLGVVSLPAHSSSPGGPVLVPFGGAEHDWAALELAAWIASVRGLRLVLAGPIGDPESGARDASRLLARASLVVQRFDCVPAEPLLTPPGPESILQAAGGAALLVVGVSPRWRDEGLGAARARLAAEAEAPVVFAARGLRPGGLAPDSTLTRFSWSLREEPGS